MIDVSQLRGRIQRDIFDYQQLQECLRDYAKPRDKISMLLRRGHIVRIKKGLYVFGDSYRRAPASRELMANLIYGPSYISMEYALGFHGLIPERVESVTSATTGQSRQFSTPFGVFTYRKLAPARYANGAELVKSGEATFLIATPEKALIDLVWADKRFNSGTPAELASYLEEDLRIDAKRLAKLNRNRLRTIATAYCSRKITLLCRYLLSLKRRRHE
jgi:predicted transcriptional regulator of viral defense system